MPDPRIEALRVQFYQTLGITENTLISEDQAAMLIDQWEQFLYVNAQNTSVGAPVYSPSYTFPRYVPPSSFPQYIPAPTYTLPQYTPAPVYAPPQLPQYPRPTTGQPPIYVQPPRPGSVVGNPVTANLPPGPGWVATHQGYKDAVRGTDGKYYYRPDGKYPVGTPFINHGKQPPTAKPGTTIYNPGLFGQVWKR